MAIKSGFTQEDLARLGPDALTRKRLLAEAMLKEAGGLRRIEHPLQGLAQMAQALAGNIKMGRLDKAEAEGRESTQAPMNAIAASLAGPGAFPPAPSSSPQASSQPSGDGGAIREGLIKRGLPEHIADAFVMNFQDESGLNPGINEASPIVPGSRGGYGLYQLTGPRRRAYEAFAKERGIPLDSVDGQLDFMMSELQGPEADAMKAIMAAPNKGEAAAAIVNKFLRPSESHRASREARYLRSGGEPVQVASLDPSIGMENLPMQAMAPEQVQAATAGAALPNTPSGLPANVQPLSGAPSPMGAPGTPVTGTPEGQQALGRMLAGGSMTGGAPMGMQGPQPTPVADRSPNPQIAQALMGQGGPTAEEEIFGRAIPKDGPSMQMLMEAAGNNWLNDSQRSIVESLIGQKMTRPDPKDALQQEKLRLEIERLRNPTAEGFTLGEGQQRFDASGRPIASGPEKSAAKPSAVQEYEYAKGQGFPGTFQDWEASKKGGMSLQVDPATGQVSFQQGGNIKPMTEGQSKDTVFATKAAGALPNLDKYGNALTSLGERAADALPGGVGNYVKSEDYQKAEQAGQEFMMAILRKETGAAITDTEMRLYGDLYLPRPGDKPGKLAQKKESRKRALEAIKAGMPPQGLLYMENALKASSAKEPVQIDGYTIEEIE